jgi:BolA protein
VKDSERAAAIRERLNHALEPLRLDVTDDSHLHIGHAGAKDGKSHFHVRIVTPRFTGLSRVQRHRLVYAALGELLSTDIHALGIDALAPGEAQAS